MPHLSLPREIKVVESMISRQINATCKEYLIRPMRKKRGLHYVLDTSEGRAAVFGFPFKLGLICIFSFLRLFTILIVQFALPAIFS